MVKESPLMQEVRCRACHRYVALCVRDVRLFCDEVCLNDFPAAAREDEEALAEIIVLTTGTRSAEIAEEMDVTRQRVDNFIRNRDIRNEFA